VRDGDWKLVRPVDLTNDGVTGPVLGVLAPHGLAAPTYDWKPGEPYIPRLPAPLPSQLFNLREDPQEQHDLAAKYPERVQRMETLINQWFGTVLTDFKRSKAE
jgi:hypothetical protein